MADRLAERDPAVDELRRKARRRLVGAIVLALAAAVLLPMLLEKEPRPLGDDVAVRIPPVDEGKFVNRLNTPTPTSPSAPAGTTSAGSTSPASPAAPAGGSSASAPPVTTSPAAGAPGSTSTSAPGANAAAAAGVPAALPPGRTPADAATATRPSVRDAEQRVLRPPAGTTAPEAPSSAAKAEVSSFPAPSEDKPAVPGAAAAEGFVVQLAAFADDKGANALVSKLKRNGYPAYTEPVTTSRGTLFRVRVGGYPSRDAAGEARNRLKAEGYSGIVAPAR